MQFIQLECLLNLYKFNSIASVAKKLGLSATTVRGHISKLESELGIKLFEQNGNKLIICNSAMEIIKMASKILRLADDARKELYDSNNLLNYNLTIASLTAPTVAPLLYNEFKKQHPDIKLKIVQHNVDPIFPDSVCDISLFSTPLPVMTSYSKSIYCEPVLLAVSNLSPLAQYNEIDIKDLEHETWLLPSGTTDFSELIDRFINEMGITCHNRFYNDHPPFIAQMLNANMGINLMPYLTWKYIDNPQFKLVKIRGFNFSRYLNLSWRTDGYFSNAMKAFISFATDFFFNFEGNNGN